MKCDRNDCEGCRYYLAEKCPLEEKELKRSRWKEALQGAVLLILLFVSLLVPLIFSLCALIQRVYWLSALMDFIIIISLCVWMRLGKDEND